MNIFGVWPAVARVGVLDFQRGPTRPLLATHPSRTATATVSAVLSPSTAPRRNGGLTDVDGGACAAARRSARVGRRPTLRRRARGRSRPPRRVEAARVHRSERRGSSSQCTYHIYHLTSLGLQKQVKRSDTVQFNLATIKARTNQGASATELKSQTFKIPRCTGASPFRCRCQASRAQLRARWWARSLVRTAAAGKGGAVGRCETGAHSPCARPSRAPLCARYERMRLSGLFLLLPYQPIYRSQPSL